MVQVIAAERIPVKDKDDALAMHLMIKCREKGIVLSEADIMCLIELYHTGYSEEFYTNCVEKGYYKSEQTVRNSVSKMNKLGILSYEKRGDRAIEPEFVPEITEDKFIMQYMIGKI